MNSPKKNVWFKPGKIALMISAILAASTLPVSAESLKVVINDSTPTADRQVDINDSIDMAFISMSADGMIRMKDNITIDAEGVYQYDGNTNLSATRFAHLTAGTFDLGSGVTINYFPTSSWSDNFYSALKFAGTSRGIAENLTLSLGILENAPSSAITVDDTASLTLTGTTTINNGGISTYGDAVLNVENLNLVYTPTFDKRVSSFSSGLTLGGKEANFTGDVNILLTGTSSFTEAISATDAFNFLGKTTITIINNSPSESAAPRGVYLFDTHATIPDPATAGPGKRYFKDLAITILNSLPNGFTDGVLYTGLAEGSSDLTIDNLDIKLTGNGTVRGVYLWDYLNEGTTKNLIKNATIQMKGSDTATLRGFFSTNILVDGSEQWDSDTVVGNIDIKTEGGKTAYLLHNADARFTGDVTLGNQLSYDSVVDKLYSIYGSYAGTTDITNHNKLIAWGTMLAKGNHTIDIVSGDNSYIYGDTQIEDQGAINLALNGNNSRWDMVGDSTVTDLALNNATLTFMPASTGPRKLTRDAATFKTLTVNGDYNGTNGNIVMNTQLGDDSSPTDRLIIAGNTSGTTNVKVLNAGGAGGVTTDGIELISVGGDSDGEFKQSGRIVAGAYDYTLQRGEGQNVKNWYLSSALSPEPPQDPVTPVDPVDPVDPQDPTDPVVPQNPVTPQKPAKPQVDAVRPEAGLYAMNLQAANNLFTTRLHDRLGETHYVDALTGETAVTSMWLRNVGGHTRQRDSSGQLNMQSNRYVMQLGGDIAQWSSDKADRYHLGVMAGYANQKSRAVNRFNNNHTTGGIDGYSVGVYGTWLQDNDTLEGAYVDSWAQYNWFDNTVSGDDVAAEEYKSKGFTASVESGYTWKLADISERNSLYIQPKAQVTWMGVKADSHKEANGTRVEGKGDGNIQTRVGVRLYGHGHNKLDDGQGRTFQPFVEANWIHNSKDFGVSLNGQQAELAGARNIGELKAGVEGQLTKNVALWGNVGQQIGDKGYSDTAAMIGIKASF